MALWTHNQTHDHDLTTVMHLLRDALRSALNDLAVLEKAAWEKPDVKGAGHAEIAARLGRFRDACQDLRHREALLVTKFVRARTWAKELRRLASTFEDDVEQFLEATALCDGIQADFLRNAHRLFDGGGSLTRFFALRKAGDDATTGDVPPAGSGPYRVGGKMPLFELRATCEVFLAQVEAEFYGERDTEQTSLAAHLNRVEPTLPPPSHNLLQ